RVMLKEAYTAEGVMGRDPAGLVPGRQPAPGRLLLHPVRHLAIPPRNPAHAGGEAGGRLLRSREGVVGHPPGRQGQRRRDAPVELLAADAAPPGRGAAADLPLAEARRGPYFKRVPAFAGTRRKGVAAYLRLRRRSGSALGP